jgi:ankyrin repeat protein
MSAMIRGNVEYVRQYLDDSAESDIFLHGVEAWGIHCPDNDNDPNDDDANSLSPNEEHVQIPGKTALHFAACEMYPQVLELLLERGADPNAADVHGRVPLAEAALWGRLENVQVLLKYGADKELECVRDGPRLRAIDFARPLRANAEERYFRSGSKHQVYKKNTYKRDLDRKAIVRLLGDEAGKPSQDQRNLGCFTFTKSPRGENLLTLVAHFDIPQK